MSDPGVYAVLANVIVITHALFVLFVVGGQGIILYGWWQGWAWTRNLAFRLLHLAAMGVVVLETWLGIVCPLTALENYFRSLAGRVPEHADFVAYWLGRILFYAFPPWVFIALYTLFFALILITLVAYPPRFRRLS